PIWERSAGFAVARTCGAGVFRWLPGLGGGGAVGECAGAEVVDEQVAAAGQRETRLTRRRAQHVRVEQPQPRVPIHGTDPLQCGPCGRARKPPPAPAPPPPRRGPPPAFGARALPPAVSPRKPPPAAGGGSPLRGPTG